MRIGELASRSGIPAHTIRFYEREGVIGRAERSRGRFRRYGPQALEELRYVRKAKALGLTLESIREIRDIASRGRPPCDHVKARLSERLADVERRLRDLRALRKILRAAIGEFDRTARKSSGCGCAVIEAL